MEDTDVNNLSRVALSSYTASDKFNPILTPKMCVDASKGESHCLEIMLQIPQNDSKAEADAIPGY
jgi:hypothetical protein